jgi:formate dehydrogenase iron-sulfur subunit
MSEAATASAPDLLRWLIDRERDMTAVERFARAHDRGRVSEPRWKELIPLTTPGPGEQYAFEVDLDACTGCKSCVTACHNLNGLDDDETWRAVGLLAGGTAAAPYQQHVTTACHHCVDPACMAGCPVDAYAKDPITGIVRHLDDQCIGCQYCTLTCPFDVPQFSAKRGIVRKCDMCQGRLAVGEAPACVQACPTEAIRITTVRTEQVVIDNEAGHFLPGAPDPGITQATTIYRTERTVPRNTLPVDWYRVRPERAHPPLTVMLVLTQLAVGAFAVGALAPHLASALLPLGKVHAALALIVGIVALGASFLHLGRPLYAFRAVLGFRRSWLSREAVAFGAFAGLAAVHAAVSWLAGSAPRWLALAVTGVGLAGVGCSVMVYVATKRDGWRGDHVAIKFGLGTALLGLVATAAATAIGAVVASPPMAALASELSRGLAEALVVCAGLKLSYEAVLLAHIGDRRHGALKRSAALMLGALRRWTIARFVAGIVGGIGLPLILTAGVGSPLERAAVATVAVVACLIGELIERHLFFVASSSPRMPGGAA